MSRNAAERSCGLWRAVIIEHGRRNLWPSRASSAIPALHSWASGRLSSSNEMVGTWLLDSRTQRKNSDVAVLSAKLLIFRRSSGTARSAVPGQHPGVPAQHTLSQAHSHCLSWHAAGAQEWWPHSWHSVSCMSACLSALLRLLALSRAPADPHLYHWLGLGTVVNAQLCKDRVNPGLAALCRQPALPHQPSSPMAHGYSAVQSS